MEIPIPKIRPHLIETKGSADSPTAGSTVAVSLTKATDSAAKPVISGLPHAATRGTQTGQSSQSTPTASVNQPTEQAIARASGSNSTDRFSTHYSECFKKEMMRVIVTRAENSPNWRSTWQRAMSAAGITESEIEQALGS